MELTVITPKTFAPAVNDAYSHAIKAGDIVFLSGQVSLDDVGRVVGHRDIRKQTRQVFENIKALLQEAGSSFNKIIRWNGYMVNMDQNYEGFQEVRREYFTKQPMPTATLVGVTGLGHHDFLIEIEVIAAVK